MMLFWNIVEPLGGGPLLEEAYHCGRASDIISRLIISSLLPHCDYETTSHLKGLLPCLHSCGGQPEPLLIMSQK